MTAAFTHLHFHTHYSLLDGAIKVKGLGKHLKNLGFNSCAITDHGNLHGAVEFEKEMKKADIKPIIGMEAYVAKISRFHRSYSKPGPNAYHTVLLCENKQGYHNLVKLSSIGYSEGKYYGKPRIDRELLEKYNEGLIVLSACLSGEICRRILDNQINEAKESAQWYADVFPGRYYIELQSNGLAEQERVNPILIEIARELNLPLIGTCDCHYKTRDDAKSQHILRLMGWQQKVTDPNAKEMETDQSYIKSTDEMIDSFRNLPEECIRNTQIIVDRCNVDLTNEKLYLPEYPVEGDKTLEVEFVDQAKEGLEHRFEYLRKIYNWTDEEEAKQKEVYRQRLIFELDVINKMGFAGYFLIVSDFIKWAKKEKIPVGPGRGSGAGSLVAYSMQITDLDPLKYDLLFERFLNPERVSMPDFDIDFEVEGRERVIDYVKQKYGEENVCQISAIGSLKAKGAIKSVARVLDIPFAEAERIAKLVPDDLGITLPKVMEAEPQLKEMHDHGSELEQKLIKTALALEGLYNNLSTHAAGVIIMDTPISDVMPTCTPTKGEGIQSQFTMKYAEDQGAVKFDFLGLRNLTIIDKTVELINRKRAKDDQLDISLIPMDDPKAFQLLCRGDTTGVFQLESEGMKALIRKLRPDCFEDIIALVALYRPGPLGSGMVDDYVERKHGRQKTKYPHPLMETVLNETYGVMVYQEQVMRTVQVLANFTLGSADMLRRAIGKKIPEVLQQQRESFVSGCKNNGIDDEKANYIFDLIDKFAGYGFNKSHSAAYALISYQTAWLKANYPVDFMAALLTIERNKPESVVKLISECHEMNIPVLPPDINESDLIFTAHDGRIRFGLNAIKNVGETALKSILDARDECERFENLLEVFSKVDTSKVNSRVLEALIKSGVFDSLEPNRKRILEGIDSVLTIANAEKSMEIKNQVSFFDLLDEDEIEKSRTKVELPDVPDWKTKTRLKFEKEALGFYISGHPLSPYFKEINTYTKIHKSIDLKAPDRKFNFKEVINIAGVISSRIIRLAKKNNEKWAALTVEDLWGTMEVLVFSNTFKAVTDILEPEEYDNPVLISGYIKNDDDSRKLIAQSIKSIPDIRAAHSSCVNIKLPRDFKEDRLERVRALINRYPGDCSIVLTLRTENSCAVDIRLRERVLANEEFVNDLEEIIPLENLLFQYSPTNQNQSPNLN
ncbi:DNA polymerase III subunit alpha [bacterium]|nr:DNA polymerase III subunit alpha [bacterium]